MTSDNHVTGLKPCPFCGGTDLIVGEDDSLHSIICRGCCCEMPYMSLDDPQSERWNTRRPSASEQASVHSPRSSEAVERVANDIFVAAVKERTTGINWEDAEVFARAAITALQHPAKETVE